MSENQESQPQRMSLAMMENMRNQMVERLKVPPQAYSEEKKNRIREIQKKFGGDLSVSVPAGLEKAGEAYVASPRADEDWLKLLRYRLMIESKGAFYVLSPEEREKKLQEAFHNPELSNQRFHIDTAVEVGQGVKFTHDLPLEVGLFELDEAIAAEKKRLGLEGASFIRSTPGKETENSDRSPEQDQGYSGK